MGRIIIPRRWLHIVRKPVHVAVEDELRAGSRELSFDKALSLGYGDHCEVRLDGESGPEIVCRLERTRGPLRVWTPLAQAQLDEQVELSVDGRPMHWPTEDVQPGSRIEVRDKKTGRRYSVLVQPPPPWFLDRTFLSVALGVLAVVVIIYGAYLYRNLRGAETRLVETEERLTRAESGMERAQRRLSEVEQYLATTQDELRDAIRELDAAQSALEEAMRSDFEQRFTAITDDTQARLEQLSEQDVVLRDKLQSETQTKLEALREEIAERMVEAYREVRGIETRLLESLSSQIKAIEPASKKFKRLLKNLRQAIVLIHTVYEIELVENGQVSELQTSGTGFFVAESGLGVTAQHVLYPWRYDSKLQVLVALGLVKMRPKSTVWTLWTEGQRVAADDTESSPAWRSDSEQRPLMLLYTPEPELADEWVETPLGTVSIAMPVPGRHDAAVFQLMRFDDPVTTVPMGPDAPKPKPLDEVLVLGYPLSRLEEGKAVSQGVSGFVRRSTKEILELNIPLNPGVSGAPVVNRDGYLVGMAIGIVESDVYGLAVPGHYIVTLLRDTAEAVRAEEARLRAMGCAPGVVDGVFDKDTWRAYQCVRARGAAP